MYTTLSPAYGADYKSKAEVFAAWLAGKDFKIEDIGSPYYGKPINVQQAEESAYNIRYDRMRKICVVRRRAETWEL